MKSWFISDTHFSHANIIRYTGRPFANIVEMNQTMIDRWNERVSAEDTVYFLGDFGLGSVESLGAICQQLRGIKLCIRGNHDPNATKLHRIGFSVVFEAAWIKLGRHLVELIHVPSEEPPQHFQLHGHVHEKRPNQLVNNQLNLSVEVWDYKPVSAETIISILDRESAKMSCPKENFEQE